MIFYSLNRSKPLDINNIIKDISILLQDTPKDNLENSILVIKLEKIINYAGDNPIPKITYQDDSLT